MPKTLTNKQKLDKIDQLARKSVYKYSEMKQAVYASCEHTWVETREEMDNYDRDVIYGRKCTDCGLEVSTYVYNTQYAPNAIWRKK